MLRKNLFFSAVFIIAVTALFALGSNREQLTSIFYSDALRDAGASEKVVMENKEYSVINGVVVGEFGNTIKSKEKLDVLKIAYSLTMARRSPLFGIAGTNPGALKQAVDELKNVVEDLAKTQGNPGDAAMVASSLYPIDFLYSLSTLEESRLKFLASGTNTDSDNYEKSLQDTIRTGKRDIENFKKSMQEIIGEKSMRFLRFGGTMTAKSMLETISLIQEGISKNENIFLERNLCVHGKIKFCDKTAIEIPASSQLQENPKATADRKIPPLVTKVREIFSEASGRPINKSDMLVALDRSKCLGALPGPYYFLVRTLTDGGERAFRLMYAEDIFFYPTKNDSGNMFKYMNTELKIFFSHVNPVNFYTCPEVGNDTGRAYGTVATAAFAGKHPSLAVHARNRLLGSPMVVYENDATTYIQTAIEELRFHTNQSSRETKNELINLLIMFNEQSAGLEFLVEGIEMVNSTNLHLKEAGVPFDLSARNLFLTHSAFPSLFLSHNPSAAAVDVRLNVQNKKDQEILFTRVKRYSLLRLSVPHEKIVADIHAFLKMHGKLFSQMENEKAVPNEDGSMCGDSIDLKCLQDEFIEKVKNFFEWNQYAKIEKCGTPLDSKCSKNVVVDVVSTNGLDAGMRLIKEMYEKKPSFRPLCHGFAMDVGAAVYQKFPNYTRISYTPLSVTCNYGFYQEYPHSLLLTTGDIKKAKEFCEYVGKELGRSVPGVEEECFRGIGRGLPFINKSYTGDSLQMAQFATNVCKEISQNENDYSNCLSGSFNQLAREAVTKNYGLSVNESDPLWLCRELPKEVQRQCYGNFKWTDVPDVYKKDNLLNAFQYTIKKYGKSSTKTVHAIIWTIGYQKGLESTEGKLAYDDFINSCLILPSLFQTDCVWGFSVGLAKHSFPGRQHEAVIDFCQKVKSFSELKNIDCASQAINYLRGFYSPNQSQKMCVEFKRKLDVDCPLI